MNYIKIGLLLKHMGLYNFLNYNILSINHEKDNNSNTSFFYNLL